MTAAAHWNTSESRPADEREAALLAQLPAFIARARQTAAHSKTLSGITAADITSRAALADLPITRKSDLIGEQQAHPPFGGHDNFDDTPTGQPQRVYLSPGPIAECDFAVPDHWRTAAALHATGFRAGMLLHNSFSYHFTPAGFMCDEGARALGGRVFPAGPGNSEQQARAIAQLRPHCYTGTPDFLLTILQRGDDSGLDTSSLTMASVSGGYLSPELRQEYDARGVNIRQWYGTADVGCIAHETIAGEPLVVCEGLLVEIIDPVTQRPCAAGEKGEVLITNFNPHYPLLRFALGDLSAIVAGASPCGRTNMRLAGWLGRADAAVKVRGLFIHPVQIERLLASSDAITAAQLAVQKKDGQDQLTLRCVAADGVTADDALAATLAAQLTDETKLRGDITFTDSISGGIIADERDD